MKKKKIAFSQLTWQRILWTMVGTAILSFGVYNIHRRVNITEGGILGLVLLLNHWFGINASIASPLLDFLSYLLAAKLLGMDFILLAAVSSISLAGFYRLWESFPPMLPNLTEHPLIAAVLGGIFVGLGVGLVVRQGGACGGDDALALAINKLTGWKLSRSYLFTDLTVLAVSLSYIPLGRIVFSLITVTISSCIIDCIARKPAR